MSSALKPPVARMTVDEFVGWDAPGGCFWQLVDGEAVAMAPTTERHGLIQAELAALLRNHLIERGSPCRVAIAPGVVPRAKAAMNFRTPDIGVSCAPPSQSAVMAEPVLLVEVLSPSNEAETRANVWAYCTIPSVREIVLVRSTRVEAEVLRRAPDGVWPADPAVVWAGERLVLESVGYEAVLDVVYRTAGLD